jgi:SagB-type dehydrogenase family enzyme
MSGTMDETVMTINSAEMVYGGPVPWDDPAENAHEAAKLYPSTIGRQLPGLATLLSNTQLQISVTRAVKRHPHLDAVALPALRLPDVSLDTLLRRRRTRYPAAGSTLDLATLAKVLSASYGITARSAQSPQTFRSVPSAGALFPLEVYVVASSVRDLEPGLYHYDPERAVLERLRRGDLQAELCASIPLATPVEHAPATLIVSAMFWRSRFKYGQRGYRFCLIESGHLVQNLLLCASACDVDAAPIGGFYDARVDALVGLDGVDESALYVVPLGCGAAA